MKYIAILLIFSLVGCMDQFLPTSATYQATSSEFFAGSGPYALQHYDNIYFACNDGLVYERDTLASVHDQNGDQITCDPRILAIITIEKI